MEPVDLGMGAAIVWGIIRHIGRWKVITFLLHFRPVHHMYTCIQGRHYLGLEEPHMM